MRNWLIGTGIALCIVLTAQAAFQTKAANDTKGKKVALTCPVSGEVIENPSKAPRYTYKGKTYYFCCTKCLNKFKASPATYLARKPAKPNASTQVASANKKACCGEEQGGSCCDRDKSKQASGKSCCSSEEKEASGNTASAGQQPNAGKAPAADAKLLCPVSEEAITMEDAIAIEYNGKRYYVCCSKCQRKFLADPETYAQKAEQLSPLQGKPIEKENP